MLYMECLENDCLLAFWTEDGSGRISYLEFEAFTGGTGRWSASRT